MNRHVALFLPAFLTLSGVSLAEDLNVDADLRGTAVTVDLKTLEGDPVKGAWIKVLAGMGEDLLAEGTSNENGFYMATVSLEHMKVRLIIKSQGGGHADLWVLREVEEAETAAREGEAVREQKRRDRIRKKREDRLRREKKRKKRRERRRRRRNGGAVAFLALMAAIYFGAKAGRKKKAASEGPEDAGPPPA